MAHDLGDRRERAIEALARDAGAARDAMDDFAAIRQVSSGRIDSVT
ncbi:hypothetical protein ACWEN3_04155 [Streptomyces sp. NPDC004561]